MNTSISFELAKLLKEKGFGRLTGSYYEYALTSKKDREHGYSGSFGWKKGELNLQEGYFINNHPDVDYSSKTWFMCSAPTIAEVVMWLYEKHGIWIEVTTDTHNNFCWLIKEFKASNNNFNSPIEAYEAAILHTLKNLIDG